MESILSGYELIELANKRPAGSLNVQLFIAARDPGQWREQIPVHAPHRGLPSYMESSAKPLSALSCGCCGCLDAIHLTRPELRLALHVRLLFTMSLISYEPDAVGFARALLRALHGARQFFPEPFGDVALAGLNGLVQILRRPAYGERGSALATRAWLMLPLEDQPRALPLLLAW